MMFYRCIANKRGFQSYVELNRFVEEFARREIVVEEERFVPEWRVGRLLDARLSCLFLTCDATYWTDVGSGQLPRLNYLHSHL